MKTIFKKHRFIIPVSMGLVLAFVGLTAFTGLSRAGAEQVLNLSSTTDEAWARYQTVTYRAVIETPGTLSYIVMTLPTNASVSTNMHTSSGTVAYYRPGQIIWRPAAPYAVAAGAKISLPIEGIDFGGASTTSMWLVAGDTSGARLAYATGTFTVNYYADNAYCPTITNHYVADENQKPGSPESDWKINPATYNAAYLSAYATQESYKCGDIAYLKVNTNAVRLAGVQVYRMGYYGGTGARKVFETTGTFLTMPQPAIQKISNSSVKNEYDASNWAYNIAVRIDGRYLPGTYLAKLSDGAGHFTYVPFTVRDDSGLKHDYLLQQATTTWQAYNSFGGASFYTAIPGNASRLSMNRPYGNSEGYGAGEYLKLEQGLVYYMEKQGYDVSYWTDNDLHVNGSAVATKTKTLILPAHDEYYSVPMRNALLDATENKGMNLVSFGANQIHRVIIYTPDNRAFDVKNAYSLASSADYYKTTYRAQAPSLSEQMVTGAQYGCGGHGTLSTTSAWMFNGIPSGTTMPGFINGEADYQNGIERAYGLGFTVPIPSGSAKLTPDYRMDNCRVTGELGIMNIVTRNLASGAKVFSGSTFAYGCFLNKSCPTTWSEGPGTPNGSGGTTFSPLSISDADSANAAKIVDNVLYWANN